MIKTALRGELLPRRIGAMHFPLGRIGPGIEIMQYSRRKITSDSQNVVETVTIFSSRKKSMEVTVFKQKK